MEGRIYSIISRSGFRGPRSFPGRCFCFAVIATCVFFMPAAALAKEKIISGSEIDYPPFCIVDANGRLGGFSVELMQAVLASMGRETTFRTGPWDHVKGWLEQGEIQALPLVGRTPEREAVFDFSFPYMSLYGAIVVRADNADLQGMADLRDRSVAVMKGDNAEEFLRREDRGIRIHTTATFDEALRELSEGRHDAVVIQRLVALRLIQQIGAKNLKIVNRPIEDFRQDFCFAVKEGDRDTLALLNEGLALVMADGTYRHLHAKWFAALELPSNRRIVVGGDHNYPPFEYLDENGRPAGYNVELTKAIARELDLDIEILLGSWSEIIQGFEKGQIDVLQGMFYSPERDLKFDFAPPHIANQCVSVVRKGEGPPPATVEELAGKRIVVQQGDIMHDFSNKNGLSAQVSALDAQEDALRELADGKHDCALVSRMTALYWIEKRGWKNLVVGRQPLVSLDYCYAVPNGHKAMLATFSEGLQVIEKTGEYRRIHEKWAGVHDYDTFQTAVILRYLAMVVIPLVLFLIAVFGWSWSLRRQVARKTRELGESADKFRHIFESANVGKSLTLPMGEINVNKAFADFLGYTQEELKSKTWQDLTPADDIESTQQQIDPLIKGEKDSTRFKKRYLHKNGDCVWADVSLTLRRDAKGNPLHFITTVIDITESRLMEEKLKNSEQRYRLLAETTRDIIVLHDMQGRMVYVNQAGLDFSGFTMSEVLGRSIAEFVPPEHAPGIIEREARRTAGNSAVFLYETEFVDRNGRKIPVEVNSTPVEQKGQIGQFLIVARDITERKQADKEKEKLQAQLIQAQKMESVGRLAGGVAHDFNNMLGVILGHTELALEQVAPGQPAHADLLEINTAALRSADLTRQLLAFARKQIIAPKEIDLNDTVEGMFKMLRRLIGEDIDLVWRPGHDLWAVKMDASQIDQVLANLCVNARDAIAGVGKVTIETQNIHFDDAYCVDHPGFVPGEYVLLAVSDDGRGMDKQTLDNIFEPFFTTKGVGEGTGLGLATVYGVVKQNNGFISVYSEPRKGTTFRIYLPRHEGEIARPAVEAATKIPRGAGETVLIVEDEAAILQLAKKMLEALGYTVLEAPSPAMALKRAEEHPGQIDLLITDVIMPEMNGRHLAARLQSLSPHLKVLFMSGYTANVIAHRGILDAGVHFIQKPFSYRDLAASVRQALEAS